STPLDHLAMARRPDHATARRLAVDPATRHLLQLLELDRLGRREAEAGVGVALDDEAPPGGVVDTEAEAGAPARAREPGEEPGRIGRAARASVQGNPEDGKHHLSEAVRAPARDPSPAAIVPFENGGQDDHVADEGQEHPQREELSDRSNAAVR